MAMLPDKMSHGGTYAGNRVAAAAAVRTLEIIRDTPVLATIEATGRRLQDELRPIIEARGLPFVFTGHPSMFGIMFTDQVPFEYRDWAKSDHDLYDAVAVGMQAHGVLPEPDSREPWFLCEAHAQGDHIDRTLSAFSAALDAALEDRARHHAPPALAELAHARVGGDD
jgi:glutamate-1-semialdehyde 2,1-aminomutase